MPQPPWHPIAGAAAAAAVLAGAAVGGAAIARSTSDAQRCAAVLDAYEAVRLTARPVIGEELSETLAWETLRLADADLLWLDISPCDRLAPSLADAVTATYASHVAMREHLLTDDPAALVRARAHLLQSDQLLDSAKRELAAYGS